MYSCISSCFLTLYTAVFCSIYYLLLFTHNLQCEDCNYFCTVAEWMGTKAPPISRMWIICWLMSFGLRAHLGPDRSGHRVHRVAMAAFWRTFHHEGKISQRWCGCGEHVHRLSLHLPSQVKLQCTIPLSGQIHYPVSSLVKVCTLWVRICWWGNSWGEDIV